MGVFVLSSCLNYLDRLTLTSLAPLLKESYSLTNVEFGYILSAFSVVYAVGAPLAGWFIDRVGLNSGISLAVAVWSLANMATGLVNSLRGLVLSRAVLGLGEAGGVPAVGKAITTYLPPSERALGHALSQIGISVGGMLAPLVAIGIATRYGWRWAFVFTGALGLLWIPLWNVVASRAPRLEDGPAPAAARGLSILRDRRLWGFVAGTSLGMAPYALWFNWITVYFTEACHLTLQQAALPAAIPPLFANLGGLAGGWLSLRAVKGGKPAINARIRACLISALLLLPTAFVPAVQSAPLATAAISFSLFWAASYSVNIYTLPLDVFGQASAAFAVSLLTCAYGAMSAWFLPLVGWLIDRHGFGPVCALVAVMPILGFAALQLTRRRP